MTLGLPTMEGPLARRKGKERGRQEGKNTATKATCPRVDPNIAGKHEMVSSPSSRIYEHTFIHEEYPDNIDPP